MVQVLERRGVLAADGPPTIDFEELRAGLGQDPDLLRELVPVFRDDTALCMDRLDAAMRGKDAREVHAAGHLLAGTASAFAATATTALARRLEQMGATGNLTGAEEVVAKLRFAVVRVNLLLEDYVADLNRKSQ